MRKIFLLLAMVTGSLAAQAQRTAACCAKPATETFAAFASNAEFVSLHEAPLPYHYTGAGTMVSFPVAVGEPGRAFLIKSATKSDKYLFVIQEWWGLNDYIKREAARLARELPGRERDGPRHVRRRRGQHARRSHEAGAGRKNQAR